jgi:hypothetical protein
MTPNQGPASAGFTWKKAIQGGIMAFAALGVIAVIYTAMRLLGIGRSEPWWLRTAQRKDRLVVADFENRTTIPIWRIDHEAFRIDLGQSPVVQIMSTRRSATRCSGCSVIRQPRSRVPCAGDCRTGRGQGGRGGEISSVGKGYVLSAAS